MARRWAWLKLICYHLKYIKVRLKTRSGELSICTFPNNANPELSYLSLVLHCFSFELLIAVIATELSDTQSYAYWYARFFPGTHDFR